MHLLCVDHERGRLWDQMPVCQRICMQEIRYSRVRFCRVTSEARCQSMNMNWGNLDGLESHPFQEPHELYWGVLQSGGHVDSGVPMVDISHRQRGWVYGGQLVIIVARNRDGFSQQGLQSASICLQLGKVIERKYIEQSKYK